MANIIQKIALIRQAVFGKDIRESIASGIEAINTEVENTTARQNVIDSQEQSRIDAENYRQSEESIRRSNESVRESNETNRQFIFNTNETNRQSTFDTNESDRQSTFDTKENIRDQNEDIRIQNESGRVENEADRQLVFGGLRNQMNESIENADEATLNTNNATLNYTDVVENTKKVYKTMVNTYTDIAISYSNPEIGWTVVTKDDHIEHRWDGTEWVSIGVSDVFDGYNIVVGSTPPINPNLIWLDSPESTKYSRIIPSSTQPDDISQIWWETDN